MAKAKSTPARRRGINSVEIGVRVLQAVAAVRDPSSLKDISARAALPASHTHRYVSSLVNCGLLKQETGSGKYDLGPAALHIGLAGLARQDGLTMADDAARALAAECSATTMLSVWGAYGPTVIRWHHGSPPVYTTLAIGSVLPLASSATGRVFLAHLPEHLLTDALKREGFKTPLAKNADLMRLRNEARQGGLASVDGSVVPGLRAYASPVLGVAGSVIAVMSCVLSEATARNRDALVHERLVATCRMLSSNLGASLS